MYIVILDDVFLQCCELPQTFLDMALCQIKYIKIIITEDIFCIVSILKKAIDDMTEIKN